MQRAPQDMQPILFFDGHCVLCNRAVQWLIRHEASPAIRFAALNSATAERLLSGSPWQGHQRSLLWLGPDGDILLASDAALATCQYLRAPWAWLALLRWIPKAPRDVLYAFVAERRLRWFGQTEHCALLRNVDPSRLLP